MLKQKKEKSMKQSSFIYMDDFCEKYQLNIESFRSMKSRNYFPESIFKGYRRDLQIDENYFLYKKQKVKKLWLKAHDNYYTLIEKIDENKLANLLHDIDNRKSVSTWSSFLYGYLFRIPPEKITNIELNNNLYLFLRYSSWIIRRNDVICRC